MNKPRTAIGDYDEAAVYEICIRGHLDDRRAGSFDGLTLMREDNGDTRLTGPVADQAALHGLLRRVRDLGIPLLSVRRVDLKRTEESISLSDHDIPQDRSNKENQP